MWSADHISLYRAGFQRAAPTVSAFETVGPCHALDVDYAEGRPPLRAIAAKLTNRRQISRR
jgi:hypothetical protein